MTPTPKPVGMVLGSREAGALDFWVAVNAEDGQFLRLDDLIYVEFQHPDPAKGMIRFYGMVDQVMKTFEGSKFDTDVFLAQRDLLPVSRSYAAHIQVTRLEPEEYLPPDPGSKVYLADGAALAKALYYDKMLDTSKGRDLRLPVGILKNGEVGYANFEFINGFKGGHVNISGVSGVAAKTSYATFLLHSIFQSPANSQKANTKALIFNVKGEDLFYLDKPNNGLSEEAKAAYHRLGLPAEPFKNVSFQAPPRRSEGDIMPDVSRHDAQTYYWDLVQFCREGLLPFLFTDRGSMSNLGFLIDQVTERLRRLVGEDPRAGQKGPHILVGDFGDVDSIQDAGIDFDSLDKVPLKSFSQLVRYIEFQLLGPENAGEDEKKPKGNPLWTARQASGTLEAFVRRLRAAVGNVQFLIRGDKLGKRPDPLGSQANLSVIDIHQLSSQGQMFVVGSILREVFAKKEAGRPGQVFVVLDELNKYAPREEDSPIKDILLDIAERGRSLGVILIGAQQTASEVERRVVGNAAIRVVGRLDAAEAERPEYRYLPASFRQRAMILPQGTMILQQPELPVPLPLTFPMPAWAMKRDEVDDSASISDEEVAKLLN